MTNLYPKNVFQLNFLFDTGKLSKNDHIAVEVLSLDSINKPKTKLLSNKWDGKNVLTNSLNRNHVLSGEMNIEEQSEFSDGGKNNNFFFFFL